MLMINTDNLAQQRNEPAFNGRIFDNVVDQTSQGAILKFLRKPGWRFGWKSNPEVDNFSFWHKHFAGSINPDHTETGREQTGECADELCKKAPLLFELWTGLNNTFLTGHRLLRCYANGQPYGTDGTIHTDSILSKNYTTIFYPHMKWDPNWGGETVFFNEDKTDSVASIFPKPNRLVVFDGRVPHIARGVSRNCPAVRITLMFKTELTE